MSEVLDEMWRTLNHRLDQVERDIKTFTSDSERAEYAGGITRSTLANAPLAASGKVKNGDMLFITNGRKTGEGAGLGTGVPCYYNSTTDQWLRLSDDTAVTV